MKTTFDNAVKSPETVQAGPHLADLAPGDDSAQPPTVMFSIPFMPAVTAAEVPTAPPEASGVVPLSVNESSLLQTYVQNTRQWFVEFASGPAFWRLFVGSGFAVLIGAVTLLVLGPGPEQSPISTSDSPAAVATTEQTGASNSSGPSRSARPSNVTLTVGTGDGSGAAASADIDDPFVESNLVSSTVRHAVYSSEDLGGIPQGTIQPVSQEVSKSGPAWLSGTIEDATDSNQPMRNHERSRPSHR